MDSASPRLQFSFPEMEKRVLKVAEKTLMIVSLKEFLLNK